MFRFFLIILLLVVPPVFGAYTPTILNFSIDSGDYVIASDAARSGAAYDRDAIAVSANLSFSGSGSSTIRFDYQLLNDSSELIPLVTASGTGTTLQGGTLAMSGPIGTSISARLTPAAQLDASRHYFVRLLVKESINGSLLYTTKAQDDTELKRLIHFTNTASVDDAVNIRCYIDSLSLTKLWALDTDPANDAFTATATLKLFRYDRYLAASPGTDTVTHRINYELVDASTGAAVAISNSSTGPGYNMDEHATSGSLEIPYTRTVNRVFNLNPGVQLDSVNKHYYVRATLTHEEVPGEPFVTDGLPVASAAKKLLHYNGTVVADVDGDEIIITSITNDPGTRGTNLLPDPTAPTRIETIATVGGSHLATDDGYTVEWGTNEYFLYLYPDGTARYVQDNDLSIIPPSLPDVGTTANVRFQREAMFFDKSGVQGNVKVFLPAGMGAYEGDPTAPSNHVLDSILDTGQRQFTPELRPEAAAIVIAPSDPSNAWHIREESKPVEITALQILWNVNTGAFTGGAPVPSVDRCRYVRKFEFDFLEASPIAAGEKTVYSNELYYRRVDPTPTPPTLWTPDANGVAEFSTTLGIEPGGFVSHFPYGAELSWAAQGTVTIDHDRILPASSSLPSAGIVEMQYARQCDDHCGSISDASVKLDPTPTSAALGFTRDGGLDLAGTYLSGNSRRDIVIGYIDALSTPSTTVYAHDSTIFAHGRFLMPGHHLDSGDFSQGENDGPGVLLNSGYDPADLNAPERPGTPAYLAGLGDYPGMNYRASAETSPPTAVSVLGGLPTPPYTLSSRSKYYTRAAGASGIHEPESNPFSGPVFIYGYEFEFESFGLSFLDSEVHDSITAGSLDIPAPSNFTLAFDPLHFNCLGGLTTANIPGGSFVADLDFWNAEFTGISALFQPAIGADCDPSEANLVLGVRTHASNLAPSLSGSLGFHANGNLITEADGRLEGIDSRLNLPSSLELSGPQGESYAFLPTQDAYYENHEHSASSLGQLSFAGLLDVPFFEDLEVHFQTGAKRGNTTDTIRMMGGWPGDGVVTAAKFDPDNRSYPSGTTLDAYRALSDSDHRIHARQNWIGVLDFDYPLVWNTTTRSFNAEGPIENDLLVVTTEHELAYLSAENAELDFGANVDLGFPEINLSNIAVNVTQNVGVFSALETALGDKVAGALVQGLDASTEILNDRMDSFYDRIFEQSINPIVDDLYAELDAVPVGFGSTSARASLIDEYLCTRADSVLNALQNFDGSVGQAGTIVDEVDQALASLQIAIRSVIGRVEVSGGEVILSTGEITVPEEAVITAGGHLTEGIFADHDGNGYEIAKILTAALIEELAPEIADSLSAVLTTAAGSLADKLEEELNAQLGEAGPTIEQVKQVLLELHNNLQEIRDSGLLYSEISDALLASTSDLEIAIEAAKDDVSAFISSIDLEEYQSAEVKKTIRLAIRDRFNASPAIASVQATLKAYLYDVDASIHEAISSGFGEMNRVIVRLLDDAIPSDASLSGMLGDVSSIAATGNIDGYAYINGDALRTVRLDAAIQLKLPDDFEFAGYIEINQLDSDGDGSCSFAGEGEYAAEVKMGAVDIPVGWGGNGLRFDVDTKFTFDTASGFALRGFGGSFEMTEGEIGFESMGVRSLGAAAMFGKDENYLAAQVGLRFESYELDGGIFFGRTCSTDPLELVDPDVVKVLGSPPFTGIYAYGEAQIPIVNAGCFFNLSAKAGAGVFWFEEGNTYGGKMVVGATGRALCAVGVGGDLTLVGAKSGNSYSFLGRGRVWGEIGKCPLCTSFSEQVELIFKNDKWDYNF